MWHGNVRIDFNVKMNVMLILHRQQLKNIGTSAENGRQPLNFTSFGISIKRNGEWMESRDCQKLI